MRLGQLSRKLGLRPAEIIGFLAGKQIQIEDGSNTRIEDDHVLMIMERFAPDENASMADLNEKAEAEEVEIIVDKKEDETQVAAEKIVNEAPAASDGGSGYTDVEHTEETAPPATGEVIEAPKIALPGLKVLGKIEFPEPKKKETPTEAGEPIPGPPAEKRPGRERGQGAFAKNQRRDQRSGKNPIALERERQAQEAEKKKQAEVERKKQQKRQHYLSKVKIQGPTKSLRLVNDPVEEMPVEQAPPPKTGLGRFFRWLKS